MRKMIKTRRFIMIIRIEGWDFLMDLKKVTFSLEKVKYFVFCDSVKNIKK